MYLHKRQIFIIILIIIGGLLGSIKLDMILGSLGFLSGACATLALIMIFIEKIKETRQKRVQSFLLRVKGLN